MSKHLMTCPTCGGCETRPTSAPYKCLWCGEGVMQAEDWHDAIGEHGTRDEQEMDCGDEMPEVGDR